MVNTICTIKVLLLYLTTQSVSTLNENSILNILSQAINRANLNSPRDNFAGNIKAIYVIYLDSHNDNINNRHVEEYINRDNYAKGRENNRYYGYSYSKHRYYDSNKITNDLKNNHNSDFGYYIDRNKYDNRNNDFNTLRYDDDLYNSYEEHRTGGLNQLLDSIKQFRSNDRSSIEHYRNQIISSSDDETIHTEEAINYLKSIKILGSGINQMDLNLKKVLRSGCEAVTECQMKCPPKEKFCQKSCKAVFDELNQCDPPKIKAKKCKKYGKTLPPSKDIKYSDDEDNCDNCGK